MIGPEKMLISLTGIHITALSLLETSITADVPRQNLEFDDGFKISAILGNELRIELTTKEGDHVSLSSDPRLLVIFGDKNFTVVLEKDSAKMRPEFLGPEPVKGEDYVGAIRKAAEMIQWASDPLGTEIPGGWYYLDDIISIEEMVHQLLDEPSFTTITLSDASSLEFSAEPNRKSLVNISDDCHGFPSGTYRQHTHIDLSSQGTINVSISDQHDVHELYLKPGENPAYSHDPSQGNSGFPYGAVKSLLESALKAVADRC